MYTVFNRTWWKESNGWPDNLEPEAGERNYHGEEFDTLEEAREYCQEWNANNEAGRYSNKCEFEEA